MGNNSKRSFENYIGGERNLTSEDEMAINVLVHIADDGHVSSEEGLRAILESPIRDTKLPLGAEVKVKRKYTWFRLYGLRIFGLFGYLVNF